ncbi:unnamed protein product [Chilo suppressalis]|uniref:AD domain-containing protein n=1 Tax=Chilo suppressalis TaxID=168631 RepID=A0ABN8AVP6_CHISP|nr:unnamed protein product [Chilo suppressalis]
MESNYFKVAEDPELLSKFIDKYVKLQVIKNTSFTGFVHSIDPISFSVLISVPQEDQYQTVLIPGHAILGITETEPSANAKPPQRKRTTLDDSIQISRKETIVKWLKWNMLPVTEDGDKIVFGNASILPPYSVMDICTDNPMVAIQMRKIIENMPHDFESN